MGDFWPTPRIGSGDEKKEQSHNAERVRVQARFHVITKYYITTLISASTWGFQPCVLLAIPLLWLSAISPCS